MSSPSVKPLLFVSLGALATVVLADVALQRVSPLAPPLLEVADGVAALGQSDPETLVLGSSHTRSFVPLRDALARASGGQRDMVLVTMEAGGAGCYDWVLEHRLRPLVEETDRSGRLKRTRLARAILVVTYYDLCKKEDLTNLPGRAWALGDYFADVLAHGMTDFNRNFVLYHFSRSFPFSILITDRGHDRIVAALKSQVRTPDKLHQLEQASFAGWQRHVEEQYGWCDEDAQKRSLRHTIDYFIARHVEVTLASFPLMKSSITEAARRTTLKRFAEYLAALAREVPVRVVDMSLDHPLDDGDFAEDFDHVTRSGNAKLAAWALDGPLRYLKEAPATTQDCRPGR